MLQYACPEGRYESLPLLCRTRAMGCGAAPLQLLHDPTCGADTRGRLVLCKSCGRVAKGRRRSRAPDVLKPVVSSDSPSRSATAAGSAYPLLGRSVEVCNDPAPSNIPVETWSRAEDDRRAARHGD